MINDKSFLAVIPARGGSRALPKKNVMPIAGKPMIAWTIEEAKKSKYIDKLILSSEDPEIINISKYYGCEAPFIRPNELSKDDVPAVKAILHAISIFNNFDYVIMLQPSSPLRIVEDIDSALEQICKNGNLSLVSVTKVLQHPNWMFTISDQGFLRNINNVEKIIAQRQELSIVYLLNGAIQIAETRFLRKNNNFFSDETAAFIMPQERSFEIDTELDFVLVELLLKRSLLKPMSSTIS
jgi:N-acylneuraminate cytidylyltransferase